MSTSLSLNEYFYNELKNIHNISNENITPVNCDNNDIKYYDDSNNGNICLISHNLLDNSHIELKCGHKFNYVPLYKDIKLHKLKYNNVESYKLKYNEIRCPYCKIIHNELLPYNSICGEPPTFGVNSIINNTEFSQDTNFELLMNPKQCTAILLKGKNKGQQCSNNKSLSSYQYCRRHHKKYVIE